MASARSASDTDMERASVDGGGGDGARACERRVLAPARRVAAPSSGGTTAAAAARRAAATALATPSPPRLRTGRLAPMRIDLPPDAADTSRAARMMADQGHLQGQPLAPGALAEPLSAASTSARRAGDRSGLGALPSDASQARHDVVATMRDARHTTLSRAIAFLAENGPVDDVMRAAGARDSVLASCDDEQRVGTVCAHYDYLPRARSRVAAACAIAAASCAPLWRSPGGTALAAPPQLIGALDVLLGEAEADGCLLGMTTEKALILMSGAPDAAPPQAAPPIASRRRSARVQEASARPTKPPFYQRFSASPGASPLAPVKRKHKPAQQRPRPRPFVLGDFIPAASAAPATFGGDPAGDPADAGAGSAGGAVDPDATTPAATADYDTAAGATGPDDADATDITAAAAASPRPTRRKSSSATAAPVLGGGMSQ